MTPQASVYLVAAQEAISDANRILAIGILRQAARLAYYAQFYSAQALIFERTGKAAKTHKGVARQFHKLAAAEPALPRGIASDLPAAYRFKEIADYDIGSASGFTPDEVQDAISTAMRFVDSISRVLGTPQGPQMS